MDHSPSLPEPLPPILAAALTLLKEGQTDFTMDLLAKTAGVSRATLYRHYPSRALVLQALQPYVPENLESGERISAREKVLNVLGSLIDRHGPLALTMEAVAQAADVNPVTLFRVFGDKDGMVRAWFQERSPRHGALEVLSDLDAPVEETLIQLLTVMLEFSAQHAGTIRLLMFGSPEEQIYLEQLRSNQESTRSRVVKFLRRQTELGRLRPHAPELVAIQLVSLAMTVPRFHHHLPLQDAQQVQQELPRLAQRLVHQLLHGLLPEPPRSQSTGLDSPRSNASSDPHQKE